MSSLPVQDDASWRALRAKHIGASEIGALFGLSPWLTRWQLYMLKTGKLPDVFETKSMTQGKHFEPAVAAYAQEKFNIQLRKVHRYLTDDTTPGMGASLDYEEYGDGSLTPTELKFSLFGDGWDWESDELTAIPDVYMLQVQHQIACADAARGQLIAFTGGDLKRMLIPRNERLVAAIREAVAAFWDDVRASREPPVDFAADAEAVSRLAYLRKLRTLTMTPDKAVLFEAWDECKRLATHYETQAEAKRAEILKAVVDAGEGNDEGVKVTCGNWRVGISKVADSLGKLVSPEMVGTYVGARRGYLTARLKKVES